MCAAISERYKAKQLTKAHVLQHPKCLKHSHHHVTRKHLKARVESPYVVHFHDYKKTVKNTVNLEIQWKGCSIPILMLILIATKQT